MIFFDERIVDDFFDSVNERFIPGGNFKMQGYVGLKKKYQRTETVEFENTRVWLTNVYIGRYFNEYIRVEMERVILKRIIVNLSMGNSWIFKRFNRLQVIVANKDFFQNIMSE